MPFLSKVFKHLIHFARGLFIILAAACGASSGGQGKIIKSVPAGNNLTAIIASNDGVLRKGIENFTLTFTDAAGKNFFAERFCSMCAGAMSAHSSKKRVEPSSNKCSFPAVITLIGADSLKISSGREII